jgi:hypothetical protein
VLFANPNINHYLAEPAHRPLDGVVMWPAGKRTDIMEKINIDTMVQKHANCVQNINAEKTCATCAHDDSEGAAIPCDSCYDEMIGLPVNPTRWLAT